MTMHGVFRVRDELELAARFRREGDYTAALARAKGAARLATTEEERDEVRLAVERLAAEEREWRAKLERRQAERLAYEAAKREELIERARAEEPRRSGRLERRREERERAEAVVRRPTYA